jgi:ubiquitin-protein ligase E3 D
MKIEILDNNNGFIYTIEEINLKTDLYKILSNEKINGINIYNIEVGQLNLPNVEEKETKFFCRHNKLIEYTTLNYLPSEDWQELIDCWSCHNNEFASVKNLSIKVRPKGILVSSFFFLINSKDMPLCCISEEKVRKIWFNELSNINHKKVVFDYLKTYFRSNNTFTFFYNDKIYEMKYFYTCKLLIINDVKYFNVMKIGIKEKKEVYCASKVNEFINSFYIELINNSIDYLNIKIMNYKTAFIYY